MFDLELKNYLNQIEKDCNISFEKTDKQSLEYYIQMIDLMYTELSYEVYDKGILYDLVHNVFKKNMTVIFDNMKKYSEKVSTNSRKSFDQLIKLSTSNKFVRLDSLNSLYQNFSDEVMRNMNIDEKIDALVSANVDVLEGQLYSKCVINNRKKTDEVIEKYNGILKDELIRNINLKKESILSLYKEFINNILSEVYGQKDLIKDKNLKVIVNTSYLYLKEKEYININKYTDENIKLINDSFTTIENRIYNELGIKRNNGNINPVKDYLLGFNNTICVKIKNVFDEMNLIVTFDREEADKKIREFNDLVTHIYEIRLIFDKQFLEYKKEFNLLGKNPDKFNDILNKACLRLAEGIKTNISNIFRDNIKIYNDIVYKTLLLKTKAGEYNVVLTPDKVKDLLLK